MAESVKRLRGLPYEANVADIQEWLKDFPLAPHGIDIQVNAIGCPMGQAWIEFASVDVAQAAQAQLHKKNMGSRYIEVLSAQPADILERDKQRMVVTTSLGPTVIKLRHLPWSADESQILKFIGANLPVSHATVVRNARGKSTGEAFVQLPEGFDRATIMRKHGNKMEGRIIDITPSNQEEMRVFLSAMVDPRNEPAPRNSDSVSPHTLWMRGMPFTCKEDDVANFFCGLNIRRHGVSLIQDYYGELTGEAVVQFETAADLAAARLREKQFMQNRFIEWQKQPSCNADRLGRIFSNNDPLLRLNWQEGERGQAHEDGYEETYDESAYPPPPHYGYPSYPPHHQPPPPHGGYAGPYYPQPYPHPPAHYPQSQYPPAYAGGWDHNGYQSGYPPHPQGYAPYPPQPYPSHPQYTDPNMPSPPPYGAYPGPYPNSMPPPPHYGYPPYAYGGDQSHSSDAGYWNGQQYDQQAEGLNQEVQENVEAEEGPVGSEGVSETALSAQSSLESAKEGNDAPVPKVDEEQAPAQPKESKVHTPQQSTPPTQQQKSSAGGFRASNQYNAQRGGPPQQQRRGGYQRN